MGMETYYLETDLEAIAETSTLKKDENFRFRNFLKGHGSRKVDLLVHKLNNDVAPRIDCTACGNCCRKLSPCLNKDDLHRLSDGLKISIDEVITDLTETDEHGLSFKHLPCSFLKENKCSIYEHRPEACSSFPHLHKDDFNSKSRRAFENYAICPIIFNVIERLKIEMHFHYKPEGHGHEH
jgi:Fe-S-cluster containining protein